MKATVKKKTYNLVSLRTQSREENARGCGLTRAAMIW